MIRRNLQDTQERPVGLVSTSELANWEGMIDVDYFQVKLNFTIPEIVSRNTQDSLYIEVKKDMFSEEFEQLPVNSTLYVDE